MKTGWVGSLGWKVGFFSLLTVVNLVQGGIIALYEFTGGQTASTDPHASSSATPLNYVGFVSSGISYGTGGGGAEPPGEHLILKASAAPQNLHAGKYFEFTVTPGIGTVLNLNSAAFRMYSEWDGTGTAGWAIRSSVDGFANNIGNTTLTTGADWGVGTVNFPGTGYDNLNSLTLRVYPWADSGSPVRYDNASLEVAAVPEPVTIALVCFGLVLGSFKVLRFWRTPRRVRIKRLLIKPF